MAEGSSAADIVTGYPQLDVNDVRAALEYAAASGCVKFLVDECLRALVAELLRDAGHDAVHAGDVGLLARPDVGVMALAVDQAWVVVSADTDLGELLALGGCSMPERDLLLVSKHRRAEQLVAFVGRVL